MLFFPLLLTQLMMLFKFLLITHDVIKFLLIIQDVI